jgi:hypothetical protein
MRDIYIKKNDLLNRKEDVSEFNAINKSSNRLNPHFKTSLNFKKNNYLKKRPLYLQQVCGAKSIFID